MNKYIAELDKYLDEHPSGIGCTQMGSVIGQLYCCHMTGRQTDPQRIRELFSDLEEQMSKLTWEGKNKVTLTVCELCDASRRESFEEGILAGFHLYRELAGREQP